MYAGEHSNAVRILKLYQRLPEFVESVEQQSW